VLSGYQSGANTSTLFDGVINVAKEEARRLRGVERAVGLEVSIDTLTLSGRAINGVHQEAQQLSDAVRKSRLPIIVYNNSEAVRLRAIPYPLRAWHKRQKGPGGEKSCK